MSEIDTATRKLWEGDQAIEQGLYAEAIELLEWVIMNPPHGGYQYMAAHAIVRAYAKYSEETGDTSPLTPGTFDNQKMQIYMNLVIEMFPEMPPDIQRGMPIDNVIELKEVFDNWGN